MTFFENPQPEYSGRASKRPQYLPFFIASLLIVLAGVWTLATVRTTPKLPPNQFRVDVFARTQVNDSQGGAFRVIVAPQEREIPIAVQYRGGLQAGTIRYSSQGKTDLTITIVPRQETKIDLSRTPPREDRIMTEVELRAETVHKSSSLFGFRREESHSLATSRGTLGDKPFEWTLEPGVYPQNQPLAIGTVNGSPVTLYVGIRPPSA